MNNKIKSLRITLDYAHKLDVEWLVERLRGKVTRRQMLCALHGRQDSVAKEIIERFDAVICKTCEKPAHPLYNGFCEDCFVGHSTTDSSMSICRVTKDGRGREQTIAVHKNYENGRPRYGL